ncbi:MAG: FAD-dependent monooxygenase [Rhodocyclaceae bacterium]|nr:FAD-dependent monooxygenase [Rhodocyclaceae bacterium]
MTATDVLIAGAGPAGLAFGLALADSGLDVTMVDARPAGAAAQDRRILALSHGSRQILERLGVWPQLPVTPIERIHVSQSGTLGRSLLAAADYGLTALGYVVAAGKLAEALADALARTGVVVRHGTRLEQCTEQDEGCSAELLAGGQSARVHARLVALCEGGVDAGGKEAVRERDYAQHAVLAIATPAAATRGLAYERFTAHGPLALLPFGRDYCAIYTCPADQLEAVMALDEAAFAARLGAAMGGRVQFSRIGPRAAFPLVLRVRARAVEGHRVWLGNAAQTLHPVAGQGYNLALRDVIELADRLRTGGMADVSASLAQHAAARRLDRAGAIGFTDGLVRLFDLDLPAARHARGLGLLALDLCPPVRHMLARRMLFGARAWP